MNEELDRIEKLIQFMETHDLTELAVKQGDLEFKARRGDRVPRQQFMFAPANAVMGEPSAGNSGSMPVVRGSEPSQSESAFDKMNEICSPIVGTFYRRPNPKAVPYKEVGDRVEKDDVVCIVEAMKVMNEVKADVSGTIKKLLVEDATPVEYGQPLFLVEPS